MTDDSLVGALSQANGNLKDQYPSGVVGGPETELGDLRAALALALHMVASHTDAAGRTRLSVPTDGEIVAEVRRLRRLADGAEGAGGARVVGG